jgi:NAD(P)-dependent dehydrogenase (short-subunit alcohol dehydrogenase family)
MPSIAGRTILVTGANRGVGRALVEEALKRGAARVYAGTRQPFEHADERVVRVALDLTDRAAIRAAAETVGDLDVLVNNAGASVLGDDMTDRALLEQHLNVNLLGTYDVTQAFLPALAASRGGIVNILSLASFANMPIMPTYSISKAALLSLTQGLRAWLAGRDVTLHAAFLGVVDTDMTKDFEGIPKASPASVAAGVWAGVERGEPDIFPDEMAALMAEGWRGSALKALELEYAALLAAPVEG